MIKWAIGIVITAVMILGVVAYLPLEQALADDVKIVITGTTGDDFIRVFEDASIIQCLPCTGLTVTGPVTGPVLVGFVPPFIEVWTITLGAGDGFDTKYEINGNGGTDKIEINDGPISDDDEFEIENADSVKYTDGPGDDTLEFEG